MDGRPLEKLSAIRLFITYGPPATRQKRKGITVWWMPLWASRAPPCRSSLERHRYPRGPPHSRGTQTIYRAQQKLHAHLGFAWSAPGRPRRRFFVDDVPPKPLAPQRRIVNFEGVPLCERSTRCHRGLPTSDTVTKVVIVWNTSAGGASSVRSIFRSFPSLQASFDLNWRLSFIQLLDTFLFFFDFRIFANLELLGFDSLSTNVSLHSSGRLFRLIGLENNPILISVHRINLFLGQRIRTNEEFAWLSPVWMNCYRPRPLQLGSHMAIVGASTLSFPGATV